MTISNLSNGSLEAKVKGDLKYRWRMQKARCAYCRQAIDYSAPANHPESIEAAHKKPVKTHPHLAYEPSNFMPSHSKCNRSAKDKEFVPVKWVQPNWD